MRRNLALRLLFALALVVQAFAPAAANVIQSARAGAGKTSFQLCLKSAPDFVNGENRQPAAWGAVASRRKLLFLSISL